ncbi:hypothetical protein C8R43DRAFT_1237279 [Mycena crocata]|nr:hypothetical protein C8R43DRAFT_1237279 [Mycena crocata]
MRSSPEKKKKKPPACDNCKARRVLCHPQAAGIPCPRCAEKGIICQTNPVPRGRPRKTPIQPSSSVSADSPPSISVNTRHKTPLSYETSIMTVRPPIELSVSPELSCELVKHLFECFVHFPHYRLPLFRGNALKDSLAAASWQLHLLPLQSRVLACCACALSASISFHPAIIGPGPTPQSFTDRSVFFPGADLRAYGVRRAPICRALYERAFTLACDARIHVEVSIDNAASCFILEILERLNDTTSRPWATVFVSHIRSLAQSWDGVDHKSAPWAGFLMAEALSATARRMPILFSRTDQLLIIGSEPPSLEQLLQTLQAMQRTSKKPVHNIVFTAIRPVMCHVCTLARDLYDNITGDYARRQPLAESSVITFISSLSLLQSIVALVLDQIDLRTNTESIFEFPAEESTGRSHTANLRACAFAISVGFTRLVLALYQEMEYRDSHDTHAQGRWAQERTSVLRRQVHEMASTAVDDVLFITRILPSLPHLAHIDCSSVEGWARFCLSEADALGAVQPARVKAFQILISALKLVGYSWDIPESAVLIDRMEAYLAQYSSFDASSALVPNFPLDNAWMFGLDPAYDSLTPYYTTALG